jgi:hypothetical protein
VIAKKLERFHWIMALLQHEMPKNFQTAQDAMLLRLQIQQLGVVGTVDRGPAKDSILPSSTPEGLILVCPDYHPDRLTLPIFGHQVANILLCAGIHFPFLEQGNNKYSDGVLLDQTSTG